MVNIKLPDLYCPFPSAINKQAEAAAQHTLYWVRSFNLITEESADKEVVAAVHELPVRCYPNASLVDLELLCDLFVLTLYTDDEFEKAGTSKQPELLEHKFHRLVDILKGAAATDADPPFAHAWEDICLRLYRGWHGMSEFRLRFVKYMEDCLLANLQEARNHSLGFTPEEATVMQMRLDLSAVGICMDLIQRVERISIPREVLDHPIVKSMELACEKACVYVNDIYSFEKEIRQGTTHNLVLVLQHKYQIPLQEAVERLASRHDTQVRTFIELWAQLPTYGTEIDAQLQRYLSAISSLMRGTLDGHVKSARYSSTEIKLG